jgi:hypothetical protein
MRNEKVKHCIYFLIPYSSFVIFHFLIASCGQQQVTDKQANSDAAVNRKPEIINPVDKIPMYREAVNNEPVAQYRERTDNPLNEWYFSVRLFETPKTFYYLIKLEYEEISGTDTLKLPNFGIMPRPVINKGAEKYSCIIGFMDKDNQFREYKKVYVSGNHLKITALKHYAVATYQK